MPLAKKLFPTQASLPIACIALVGIALVCAGTPFLQALRVCGALWLLFGLMHIAVALDERRLAREPGVLRAFTIMVFSSVAGPFAYKLFPG